MFSRSRSLSNPRWRCPAPVATISAPSNTGTYYVWVRCVPTLNDAEAIQNFKDAKPIAADEARDDRWEA